MAGFDNITVLVITGIAHGVLALLLLFFRKPESQQQVIRFYAQAHICLGIGLLLIIDRRSGSLFWSSTVPNMAVTLGLLLLALSLARFFRWQTERYLWTIAIVFTLAQLFLREWGLPEHFRLAAAIALASTGQFVITWIYARHALPPSPLTQFLAIGNLTITLLLTWRFFEALLANSSYDFFNAGLGQVFGLFALFLNALINGFGFLLLLNESSSREMVRLTSLDPLTQTLNRKHLVAQVHKELTVADRHNHPLYLAIVDIDNLGLINQQHHYFTGDEVMKMAAQQLQEMLLRVDSIGRWTGKSFLLLLPEKDPLSLQQWMMQAQQRCARFSVNKLPTIIELNVIVSATVYHHHEDFQLTLNRLESALQLAKNNDQKRFFAE